MGAGWQHKPGRGPGGCEAYQGEGSLGVEEGGCRDDGHVHGLQAQAMAQSLRAPGRFLGSYQQVHQRRKYQGRKSQNNSRA